MKDDFSHPPSSPQLPSGKGVDQRGANAVCKDGNPGSVEAGGRNIFAHARVHDLRR